MAYAIVRTDNLSGTKNPADLVSLKFKNSGVDAPVENGHVVLLDGLEDREVYKAKAPAANSPKGKVVLVASTELMRDERMKNLNEFRNGAGVEARGYALHGTFSATKEAFDGTPVVGHIVELQASTKLKIVATATASSTTIGEIVAIEDEYVVIRCY